MKIEENLRVWLQDDSSSIPSISARSGVKECTIEKFQDTGIILPSDTLRLLEYMADPVKDGYSSTNLISQLRAYIINDPESIESIARGAGCSGTQLRNFVHGKSDLRLETVSWVMEYLGIWIHRNHVGAMRMMRLSSEGLA